jgi:phosphatidylserine decarboxylase
MLGMAGELKDNRGRGDAQWRWPAIHPEGRKFGLIGVGLSLLVLLWLDWEIIGWPLLALSVPQEPAFPAISPLSPFSQPEQQRL